MAWAVQVEVQVLQPQMVLTELPTVVMVVKAVNLTPVTQPKVATVVRA